MSILWTKGEYSKKTFFQNKKVALALLAFIMKQPNQTPRPKDGESLLIGKPNPVHIRNMGPTHCCIYEAFVEIKLRKSLEIQIELTFFSNNNNNNNNPPFRKGQLALSERHVAHP